MAWESHIRTKYTDFVRGIIGDKAKILFDEDELITMIESFLVCDLTTTTLKAQDSRYRIHCGPPVYDLTITTGVADAVYIIDEAAGWVIFDALDPDNSAAAPADGDEITVTYYRICHKSIISELFMILSSNHAKLVSSQNILGSQMDLKEISDAFYAQAVRWAAEIVQG